MKKFDTFTRRAKIIKKLSIETSESVFNLANEFKVSVATIRRDLNFLNNKGVLLRTHGGAFLKSSASSQRFATRENISKEAKILIAQAALQFVKSGNSIAINDGTTNYYFAKLLSDAKFNQTIITSGLNIASILSENKNFLCYLAGGRVNNIILATSGSHAENMIDNFNPDVAFISADGLTIDQGLTFAFEGEANVAKKMIERSKKSIALITEEKFKVIDNISAISCSEIDVIVTSTKKYNLIKPFKRLGINVVNSHESNKTNPMTHNIIKFNGSN